MSSVVDQVPYNEYAANGVATSYPYEFQLLSADDLVVTVGDVETTDFALTGLGDQSGGSVTFTTPPANLLTVRIARSIALSRDTDYQYNGDLLESTVDRDFNRLWMAVQDARQKLASVIRFPFPEVTPELPPPAARKGFLLGFDVVTGAIAMVTTAADSAINYALQMASSIGASLVGSSDAGNYFNGATIEAILQEIANPKGQLQLDGVNVLRYIPPAQWAAVMAGTSAADLKTYLQSALTAEPNLIFPDGLFNTSVKLIPRIDSKIRGINRRATKLNGTAGNIILEFPINNVDCVVENIFFTGSGCTGVAVANTAGGNHDYLIRPHFIGCDWAWELAYGINALCIYATVEKFTFGYYGTVGNKPVAGASTMVAIRSYAVSNGNTNFANLNVLRDGNISAGSLTAAAVDLSGGVGWEINNVDWSFGGKCLLVNNIAMLKFRGTCWSEGNASSSALFQIVSTTVPVDVDGLNLGNNTCTELFRITSGAGGTAGLNIRNSFLGMNSPSYVLFDTTTGLNTLPADGCVAFYGNVVGGGNAANKIVTGTEFRGGRTSPRLTAIFDTTGSGSIVFSSDPSLTLSRTGTGDITLTSAHPFGSAQATVMPLITGRAANADRAQASGQFSVRCQLFTDTSTAQDGIATLVVYGA